MSSNASGQTLADESPHAHLRDEYDDVNVITDHFHKHAADLLDQLSEEDLVSGRDMSQFDAIEYGSDSLEEAEDVHVMSTVDSTTGIPTAVLRVTEEFENGTTNVFVLPEAGRSYATIEYDTGKKVLKTAVSENEAETSDATTEETCEFQKTTTNCDMSDSCETHVACTICSWGYFILETWDHYECTRYNQTPSGPVKETYQTKELVDTTCSTECCESGNCGLCPGGC